jgi:hypothetical protein
MSVDLRRLIPAVLLVGVASAAGAGENTGASSSDVGAATAEPAPDGGGKGGGFFKKFVDDVKAGVKASNPGLGSPPPGQAGAGAASGNAPAKAVLPSLDDGTEFGRVTVAGLRIGMTESAAIRVIQAASPKLAMHPYWLSTSLLSEQKLRGAIGSPKPLRPDASWERGAPYLKVGLEFTSGSNFGGDCLQALRPGVPDTPVAAQNQTCERIWLQLTPGDPDEARVVAISRTLVFGGSAEPPLEGLVKDVQAKYGKPSRIAGTNATSKGDIPALLIWAFDGAGKLEASSAADPLSDRIAGWDSAPVGWTGGYSGRVNVIGGDEGPEFTRLVHISNNPRQLTVAINPSSTGPLLAGRLHVTLMDPGGVLKNHELRIAAANRLIDAHNARINQAQQNQADRAAGNKPAL